MGSIVIELQKEALDPGVKTSDLLRKALVVAKKLKLIEFESWINNELNGYSERRDIPKYRLIRGEIKAYNPFRGWIPTYFEDSAMQETLSKRENGQSISELEALISKQSGSGMLQMPFPAELQKSLMVVGGHEFPTTMFFPASSVVKILDAVRNIILNWALKLEEDNVLGENFSFSPNEQKKAAHSQNINNFFGPVNQSQIQQGGSESVMISVGEMKIKAVKDLIADLSREMKGWKLRKEDRKELESEIKTIESQIESPKPKSSIIREGLSSIGRILEGLTGNVGAELLLRLSGLK